MVHYDRDRCHARISCIRVFYTYASNDAWSICGSSALMNPTRIGGSSGLSSVLDNDFVVPVQTSVDMTVACRVLEEFRCRLGVFIWLRSFLRKACPFFFFLWINWQVVMHVGGSLFRTRVRRTFRLPCFRRLHFGVGAIESSTLASANRINLVLGLLQCRHKFEGLVNESGAAWTCRRLRGSLWSTHSACRPS